MWGYNVYIITEEVSTVVVLRSYDRASWQFLVKETNRRTEFQFYCYYDFTCFGQSFCPPSGVLSRKSALVHFMQLWWPFGTRSRMELQFHPAPGNKWSSDLHKMYQCRCTAKGRFTICVTFPFRRGTSPFSKLFSCVIKRRCSHWQEPLRYVSVPFRRRPQARMFDVTVRVRRAWFW